ncbi:hypothetical protein (macronuclear) [Paramecium tetraurelia strain d4-2]|uniref:Movement protein n=1 Tax=Paramecium tetraurelia TaxID=5888 RepID=Q6BFS7_PARTE|nr:hypothetical protein [Paramecium tetraurelia strain d4-2]CAH03493.1 hypothetical protein PTMB.295c [Paramecium tetraurelia]
MKSKQVHKENIFQKYKPQKPNTQYKQHTQKSSQFQFIYANNEADFFQSQIQRVGEQQDQTNQQTKQQQSKPPQQQTSRQINLLDYGENFTSVEASKIQVNQPKILLKNSQILTLFKRSQNLDDRPNQQIQGQIEQSSGPDLSFLNLSPLIQNEPCLRMLEKMVIAKKDGRLKELKIFGQVALEGDFTFDDQSNLQLLIQYWSDTQGCQRRITPNSLDLQLYRKNGYKMGIIDYIIIPTRAFIQQRIPVSFCIDWNVSFASYCLQYKVNDLWRMPLQDIVIEVNLENDVEFDDLKTIPVAQIVKDKKITWKSKQLLQQQKGKQVMNFMGIKKARTPNSEPYKNQFKSQFN